MSLDAQIVARRGAFELTAALEADRGEMLALLGPNGAGKSTVVAALAGLIPVLRGRVALDGIVLDEPAAGVHVPAESRPVGVVFQGALLFPHMSAIENVSFPLRARGIARGEANRRAAALLERLGVAELGRSRPDALSGGEAQRVALARALANEPRLLLLDEPMSALDVRSRARIRSLVREIADGFDGVCVLVTHDPVEAMTLADRIVLIEEGAVTQTGTPAQIRGSPRTPYAADLVGLNAFGGRLEPIEEGAGRLVTGEGDVVVAWPPDATLPTEGAIGLLRPADVSLHIARPEGSARNVLRGRVAAISVEGERARVRIASSPPVVAEITLGSLERLELAEGVEVWASFKAVEVKVLLP